MVALSAQAKSVGVERTESPKVTFTTIHFLTDFPKFSLSMSLEVIYIKIAVKTVAVKQESGSRGMGSVVGGNTTLTLEP